MKVKIFASFILCICTFIILISCVSNDSIEDDINVSEYNRDLFIEKHPINLSSSDAKKVANIALSRLGRGVGQARSTVHPYEIQEVRDSLTGNVLMYIMNSMDYNGFIIISANKNTSPILAFSQYGAYDPQKGAASMYVEAYAAMIKDNYEQNDSLRSVHALEWAEFEQAESHPQSRAIGNIRMQMDDEIACKTALGYTYIGNIRALAYYMSDSDYQGICLDIESHTDPNYDYKDVTLFFIKSYEHTTYGPIIGTLWHQGEPFNYKTPNRLAGCVPIAIAQIMYYHRWPAFFNWNAMDIYPASSDTLVVGNFLDDVREKCDVYYEDGGTGAGLNDAKHAFETYGYVATDVGVPGASKLRTQIYHFGRPAYLCGTDPRTNIGHAWVCEGYMDRRFEGVLSVYPSRSYNPGGGYMDYNVMLNHPSDEQTGEFFYMNMGWGPSRNGWYRANSYDPCREKNYTSGQHMLTIQRQ